MNKKHILSIALYTVAGLLLIYAVWAFVQCARIISDALQSGQLTTAGNLYDIVSFYVSSSVQYLVFALLLTASGVILQKLHTVHEVRSAPVIVAESGVEQGGEEKADTDNRPTDG